MPSGRTIKLRKGFDIKLPDAAVAQMSDVHVSEIVAVKPDDFKALVPKLRVQEGDDVKAGDPLFFDKLRPEIKITAPVSGEIAEIVRGAKRHILEVRILTDKAGVQYRSFGKSAVSSLSREAVIKQMLESGVWAYVKQRPYGLIADPEANPKAVFVSCFDSAPLAPDVEFLIDQEAENFKTGLQVLSMLGNGVLHLGIRPGQRIDAPESAHVHTFSGPHPAGNVGIQIHHIDPIRADETVWTVAAQDVLIIGRLFHEGRYRADRFVALCGEGMSKPCYINAVSGQRMDTILDKHLKEGHFRVIQGNVLTGKRSDTKDSLSFYTNQITAIPEGDQPEFLGWLLPGFGKLSLSRTFFSWLSPKRSYHLDTNMHGEERNFVMTGEYEKVLPMNILPVFLLKSIMARDVERMEQLGIYEILEEDLALCEFVCTSKIDVQKIVSEGLDYMRTEA